MRARRKYGWGLAGLILLALGAAALRPGAQDISARSGTFLALEPALATPAERGVAQFAFGDWDALTSDAMRVTASPWKLTTAALALQEARGDAEAAARVDLGALFRRWGFHSPETLANWPDGLPAPRMTTPLGQNTGTGANLWPPIAATIGNMGCAACHSGVTYDAAGRPDPSRVWLGGSNSSINLEGYTQAIFTALRDHGEDPALMETLAALYPETGWRERLTLRAFILPELNRVVAERDAAYGRLMPFRASMAGATNGLDSLKSRLGLIPEGEVLTESIFNSVPDLGDRVWRTKLLNSGSYAVEGTEHDREMQAGDITDAHLDGLAPIVAYFTVPAMGVSAEVAEGSIPAARDVLAWMEDYEPQPFPGEIEAALAEEGRAIYAEACAACHGSYTGAERPQLTGFPNWEGDVGTDPARAELLTQEVADAVNGGPFGQYIAARTVSGYTAPPLAGLWSSAPYLHNGSVPTLWHLMRPETRPARFDVGGHMVDLERVGIELDPPEGYVPWSEPVELDTTLFGLGNGGHEIGFEGLNEAQKDALLEFLKRL